MRSANIYVNNVLAGVLTEHNDGTFSFRYDDSYFADSKQSSISLTLPKTQQEYRASSLFPFFYNMLSEGANKQVQACKFRLDENDDFGFLLATAKLNTIGAITVKELKEVKQ